MNTDRWYYRVFQSAPDLIRSLLPGSAATATVLGLDPGAPGDQLYRFEALEIKELSHRLDGVLWPRQSTGCAETGSPEFPVVLLEVQMHPDQGFHHRLKLGPTQALQVFLEQQVMWLNLEELSQQPDLDPLLNLLTLPVRPAGGPAEGRSP